MTDEASLALATAATEYHNRFDTDNEIEMLTEQLADVDKSLNNLVSAIEAGIFSSTTQARLAELETRKRDLSRLLSVAKEKTKNRLSRAEILATLELFKYGDVTNKDYQEALIDTFLVAAYVYDDKVKFVFNLGKSKEHIEVPFDIDTVDPSGVCKNASDGDQNCGNDFCHSHNFYRRKGLERTAPVCRLV